MGSAYDARCGVVLPSHTPQFLAFGEGQLDPAVAAIIDTSMDSGYKKPAGTSGTDLEYWASRLLADTTDYTWWNLYTKDYTDKTITAFGFRDIGRGWSNAGQPEARIYGRQERGAIL